MEDKDLFILHMAVDLLAMQGAMASSAILYQFKIIKIFYHWCKTIAVMQC